MRLFETWRARFVTFVERRDADHRVNSDLFGYGVRPGMGPTRARTRVIVGFLDSTFDCAVQLRGAIASDNLLIGFRNVRIADQIVRIDF